ncbi:MAG: diaminopimelate decarboxylase [Polyangiaceae bacterium]|nr:diaminopimelate decarboxylase [Polyangiaceae bacterium]
MPFERLNGAAVLGQIPLTDLFDDPERFGAPAGLTTPAYVYDLDAMVAEARALQAGFEGASHLIAFAVKACSAGPVLRAFIQQGLGAEVVSGGELEFALRCGAPPDRILMSGVGKSLHDIDLAIGAGESGILAIQLESVEEVARVAARAKALQKKARVSIRFNPSVEADTHAHVATGHDEAKFGVSLADWGAAVEAILREPMCVLTGVSTHIGSQLTRIDEYVEAARALRARAASLPHRLSFIDFGGGFGIDYGAGCPVKPADFARAVTRLVADSALAGTTIAVEPGRSLVASHAVLCASTVLAKVSCSEPARRWLLIDAGMNDLLRPALYAARHRIEPMEGADFSKGDLYRVAGPVCESSDDFGEYTFSTPPKRVVIRDAGAYGYTMASEYNGRPLPSEVFVSGGRVSCVHIPRSASDWAQERASIGHLLSTGREARL